MFLNLPADCVRPDMGLLWTWFPQALCQESSTAGRDPEREKLWAELFDQLDVNKDGRIDIEELRAGLAGKKISKSSLEKVNDQSIKSQTWVCVHVKCQGALAAYFCQRKDESLNLYLATQHLNTLGWMTPLVNLTSCRMSANFLYPNRAANPSLYQLLAIWTSLILTMHFF